MSWPPGTLAWAKRQAEAMLTDTCEILIATTVQDESGGWTDIWPETGTVTKCRVTPTAGMPEEKVIAARLAGRQVLAVALPAGTAVTERDRLRWRGHLLNVRGVLLQTDEVTRRVVAEKIA